MGQTSSQLGPPHLTQQPAIDDESRKSKGKKSRSKRSKRKDEGVERAALEEESARALMQLSSAGLNQDARAPYFNQDNTLQPPALIAPPVAHDQAVDQTYLENAEMEAPPKKKKKKRKDSGGKKNRKLEEPEDFSFVNSPGPGLPSTPPSQRDHTPPLMSRPSLAQSAHPLDEEPSDDEMVQEYETGVPNTQQPHSTQHDNDNFSQRNPESVGLEDQGLTQFAYDLPPGGQGSPIRKKTKKSSKKRKRQTAENTDGGQGQHSPQKDGFGAWGGYFGGLETPADEVGSQDDDMPIDPDLNNINFRPPSHRPESLDESGSEYIQEDLRQSKKHRKRRRVEQHQDAGHQRTSYDNAYNVDKYHGRQGDEVLQGLEDEKNQMSMELGTPYTEETDVEELRRQHRESKSTKKTKKSGGKGGFTAAEISNLDKFKDHYCQANEMSPWQFNEFIQSNIRTSEQAINIYSELHELFPYKTRSSVQRFCRRRFHNFHARGVWTAEEDEDLKQAVAQKGTSWKLVGAMLGRFGEDCRDRYRNYLAPSAEHRNKDAWTQTEVFNLSNSILDCMRTMQHERQRAKEEREGYGAAAISETDLDQDAEDLKLVNWQTVSDNMGSYGTARSRIQCSFKWSKIKRADRDRYLKEIRDAHKNLANIGKTDFTANNMRSSTGWRLKLANRKVKNMKSGDRYDLLMAILKSDAPEEENIPWRLIGGEQFRERWGSADRKAGWLMMKEELRAPKNRDYRTVVRQLLAPIIENGAYVRWDPEVHGWVDGAPEKRSRKLKEKGSKKSKKRSKRDPNGAEAQGAGPKSSKFVHESDEEEVPTVTAPEGVDFREEFQDRNRFDARRPPGSKRPGEQSSSAAAPARSESPNSLFDDDDSADSVIGESKQRVDFEGLSPDLAYRIQSLAHAS